MKILWWSVAFPLMPTGYARVSLFTTKELKRRGHDVSVVSAAGHSAGVITHEGVKFYPNPTGSVAGVEAVQAYANRIQPDLIIFLGDPGPYSKTIPLVAKDWPLIMYSPVDALPMTHRVAECVNQTMGLATFTRWSVQVAKDAGCSNVWYVPHGVDTSVYNMPSDAFVDRAKRNDARHSLGWEMDPFIFLIVSANNGDRKNLDGVLRAFAKFMVMHPKYRGKVKLAFHTYPKLDNNNRYGYDLWELSSILDVGDQTYWTEPFKVMEGLPDEQMVKYFQGCDALLLPSRTEGFGLPLIEAGACGRPAITTNFGAMAEIVSPGCGALVPVADYRVQQLSTYAVDAIPSTEALATTMKNFVDDPNMVRDLGRNMAAKVFSEYTWGLAGLHWEDAFKQALDTKQPQPTLTIP